MPRASRAAAARVAAAAAALAAVAALGWWAGGASAPQAPISRAVPHTVELGAATVAVSGDWTPTKDVPGLALGNGSSTAAFQPLPGLSAHAVVSLAPITDPSLIPAGLEPRRSTGTPEPSGAVLAGLPAWRYPDLPGPRRGAVSLTVLPTTAGVLSVACVAPRQLWSLVRDCAAGVEEIRFHGAGPLTPHRDLAMRLQLTRLLPELDNDRRALRRRLARARTPGGQAHVARRLAELHASTASAVRPWVAGEATRNATAAVRSVARAYRRLARAAARGHAGRYAAARRGVRRSEARAARAFRALAGGR